MNPLPTDWNCSDCYVTHFSGQSGPILHLLISDCQQPVIKLNRQAQLEYSCGEWSVHGTLPHDDYADQLLLFSILI